MSNFVKAASVLFETKAQRNKPESSAVILAETKETMKSLSGYGLDLVVFSEGVEAFGQTPQMAENLDRPGDFFAIYSEFAVAEKCHVAGSLKTVDNSGKVYNSIAFFGPDGSTLGIYNKTFLTHIEIEMGLTAGAGPVVVDTPIGRLGGAVCFDLNFEQLRNGYKALRPDIICFASMYHGGLVQQMWAYECRSYLVSALPFHGGGILDPFGKEVATTDCYTQIATAAINLDRVMVHLDYNRDKFPEIRRKYLDDVLVDIPANIGPAMILSLSDKRTAMDIVREFDLELLDDYMARAISDNENNRNKFNEP